MLRLLLEVLFPKTPSGWVKRASSNSNFCSRLGCGDVEMRRFLALSGLQDVDDVLMMSIDTRIFKVSVEITNAKLDKWKIPRLFVSPRGS